MRKKRVFTPESKIEIEQRIIRELQETYDVIDSSAVKYFTDFPLSPKTLAGLKDCDYVTPTEIQRESIGLSLRGLDILGAAMTGSGKTLAFLIPVLEVLYCKQWTRVDGLGALIITPTRELAYQIFETLKKVGAHHDVSAGLIIGGKDLHYEKSRVDQCNIIICTPGRLLQHMDENPLFDCSNMMILVLDEADRCLDLGFQATMNNIIANLPPERQTLLFSATQTKSVRDLARLSLKDPMYVSVHEHAKHSTPESLQQSYIVCELHEKLSMIWSFIKSHLKQKILIFMSSCKQVKYFYELFCRMKPGITLMALYGTLHQLRRMSIYETFCRKKRAVLFATDIAARGLDFPEVNWVVQLDCPEDSNTYIHRAGRTARYHRGGESLLVLMPSEEPAMIEQLKAKKIPIKKIKINPTRLQTPQVKIEALVARDFNLKESAQRAVVSYAKSVYLMKDKKIFNVNALDFNSLSRSLGLVIPPRIRFLRRAQKKEELKISKLKETTQSNVTESESAFEGVEESSAAEDNQEEKNKLKLESFNFGCVESDSDDDIFKVKRKNHDLPSEEEEEALIKQLPSKKKIVTKVALSKKALRKKIVPNKKTIFNEEGEPIVDHSREKISSFAREYESEVRDGIDIEISKKILREEDKFDKVHFRERVKAKRRLQKMKKKNAKEKEEEEEEHELEESKDFMSDESDEGSVPDLSWLPDPDKVYQSDTDAEEDDQEDDSNYQLQKKKRIKAKGTKDFMSDESDEDSIPDKVHQSNTNAGDSSDQEDNSKYQSGKRKLSKEDVQRKKPRSEDSSDLHVGSSIKDYEELALYMLKNV